MLKLLSSCYITAPELLQHVMQRLLAARVWLPSFSPWVCVFCWNIPWFDRRNIQGHSHGRYTCEPLQLWSWDKNVVITSEYSWVRTSTCWQASWMLWSHWSLVIQYVHAFRYSDGVNGKCKTTASNHVSLVFKECVQPPECDLWPPPACCVRMVCEGMLGSPLPRMLLAMTWNS